MKTKQSNCSHKFKYAEVEINSVFPPVSDDIDCVYSSCCSNLYDSLAYSTVGCILDHRVSWTGSRLKRVSHYVSKTDSDFLFLSKRDSIPLAICACSEQHGISFLFVPNKLCKTSPMQAQFQSYDPEISMDASYFETHLV